MCQEKSGISGQSCRTPAIMKMRDLSPLPRGYLLSFPNPLAALQYVFIIIIYIFLHPASPSLVKHLGGHLPPNVATTRRCCPSALHGRRVASGACAGTAAPRLTVGDKPVPDPWLGWSQRCEVIGRCLFVLSMNTELFSPRRSLLCKAKS